jgi:hypothetical protein
MGTFIEDLEKARPQVKSFRCRSTGQSFEIIKHLIIARNLEGKTKLVLNYTDFYDIIIDAVNTHAFQEYYPGTVDIHIRDLLKRLRKEGFHVPTNEDDEYTFVISWGPKKNL